MSGKNTLVLWSFAVVVLVGAVGGSDCSCPHADFLLGELETCCSCSAARVSEAARGHFRGVLEQLVRTPLFRLYSPYPTSEEIYNVQCTLPEFPALQQELVGLAQGCAISACGCEADCEIATWRHEPCFTACADDFRSSVAELSLTRPAKQAEAGGPVQYDLLENPEQFTGYGTLLDDQSARLIWESLYTDQFCFTSCAAEASKEAEAEESVEKRLVFRMVSGVQASVNTHIAMHYAFHDAELQRPVGMHDFSPSQSVHWGGHRDLFHLRVGQHPERVRNMHFVFAVLARALALLGPHLDPLLARAALPEPDRAEARGLLMSLVEPPPGGAAAAACSEVLAAFDPAALFAGDDGPAIKAELERRVVRMGELMTCVGCDRCKLWGTLQFHAVRAALGVLLYANDTAAPAPAGQPLVPRWGDLTLNDVVALVNALAQLSKSIDQAHEWGALGDAAGASSESSDSTAQDWAVSGALFDDSRPDVPAAPAEADRPRGLTQELWDRLHGQKVARFPALGTCFALLTVMLSLILVPKIFLS